MRRIAAVLSVMVLLCADLPARAEGVGARAKLPSTSLRLHGAVTILRAAWGLVALGGSQLQILPAGKTKWQVVHKVAGDPLYRVAVDDSGRLLASWEQEPSFHLFVPKTKQHLTIPKPPAPSPDIAYGYALDGLFFTKDGTAAIVFMQGSARGGIRTMVGYRYELDHPTEPTLLFRQFGYSLQMSSRLAVLAIPKKESQRCESNGCWPITAIIAWEIIEKTATKRLLLDGSTNDNVSIARPIFGDDDPERVNLAVVERPGKYHVLRWRIGDPNVNYRPLPRGPGFEADVTRMTATNDLLEAWLTTNRGLEVRRHSPQGEMKTVKFPPLLPRTPDDRPLFGIRAVAERKSGDLIVHWGDYFYLLAANGSNRRFDLRPVFKNMPEFAGTMIYIAEPEGLWLGVEVGGGRDFVYLSLTDIDAQATPLP